MRRGFGRVILLAAWAAVLAGCGSEGSGRRGDADNANLIVNGSFEAPDIAPGISAGFVGGWEILHDQISGWAPVDGNGFEIFDNVIASSGVVWRAYEGDQFAELDADANGGISQTITTVPQASYYLYFAYSPRPGGSAATNTIMIHLDGINIDNVAADGIAASPSWTLYRYSFIATGASTTVGFTAAGDSDGVGGFLDHVMVFLNP